MGAEVILENGVRSLKVRLNESVGNRSVNAEESYIAQLLVCSQRIGLGKVPLR